MSFGHHSLIVARKYKQNKHGSVLGIVRDKPQRHDHQHTEYYSTLQLCSIRHGYTGGSRSVAGRCIGLNQRRLSRLLLRVVQKGGRCLVQRTASAGGQGELAW